MYLRGITMAATAFNESRSGRWINVLLAKILLIGFPPLRRGVMQLYLRMPESVLVFPNPFYILWSMSESPCQWTSRSSSFFFMALSFHKCFQACVSTLQRTSSQLSFESLPMKTDLALRANDPTRVGPQYLLPWWR